MTRKLKRVYVYEETYKEIMNWYNLYKKVIDIYPKTFCNIVVEYVKYNGKR